MTWYLFRNTVVLCDAGGSNDALVASLFGVNVNVSFGARYEFGTNYLSKCFLPTLYTSRGWSNALTTLNQARGSLVSSSSSCVSS